MNPAPPKPDTWPSIEDYNSLVHFIRKHVQPPSSVYVTRDDVLELLAWVPITQTTVNLSVRFQAPDGQVLPRFETFVIPPSAAAAVSHILQNAEGFLISASIETPGAPRGQAFVALRVRRGGGSADITQGEYVLAGYPGAIAGLSFPGSLVVSPADGRGRVRSIAVANPAAGVDWSLVVPAGVAWRVLAVTANFTTGAAVGDRVPNLLFLDGAGNTIVMDCGGLAIGASIAATISLLLGGITQVILEVATEFATFALPDGMILPAGFKIEPSTFGIAAADQWSAIMVTVEEFVAT